MCSSDLNGILLFRYTSDVVCAYGRRLMATAPPPKGDPEIYKKRYKGLSLSLHVLNSALGGNYVCFGVFELYNDMALQNALDVALNMALSVPLDDVNAYPKLSKAYYSFIEILFRYIQKFLIDSICGVYFSLYYSINVILLYIQCIIFISIM